jgi:hypothetical protein
MNLAHMKWIRRQTMKEANVIFKQNYQHYLKQIQKLDLNMCSKKLGLVQDKDFFLIRILNQDYIISEQGIFNTTKESAPYEICIIVCRYLLMSSGNQPISNNPMEKQMVSFRDFKDSGPLTVYFTNDVEMKINQFFAGKIQRLIKAGNNIGGYRAGIEANYDFSARFDVLPKIPIVLLFNDKDAEFDAQTKLLFEKRAEHYLDAECLAIIGNILYQSLIK